MGKAIGIETRREAVLAVEAGESIDAVARRLGVSVPSLGRWLRASRAGESLSPKPMGGFRWSLLDANEREQVVAWARAAPDISREALQKKVQESFGKSASIPTLSRILGAAQIKRKRPQLSKQRPEEPAGLGARYQEHHRDPGSASRYPNGVTDVEWELIRHHFEREGGRGRPEIYPRRSVLDAILYAVRTGCPWRMLPKDLPPWDLVYATFRTWAADGRFEKMHDELRGLWRARLGRQPSASGAIIDSQTVKTTEKGGPADTTEARRSPDASGTL